MFIFNRLIEYRDLLLVFAWREFSIRYRQSVIGVLWAAFQPLSMMLLFTFIFTYLMPTKVAEYSYALFFYSGMLPWIFFSGSINYAVPSLTNHYQLITKIYFPREILPLSGIIVAIVDFFIGCIVYALLILAFRVHVNLNILWSCPLFFMLFLFTTGICFIMAAMNVYYRDVKLATNFLIQLWFFATPIFYSLDRVPMKFKWILFLNPMTFIVENMRRCVIEGRAVIWWQYLIMLIFVSIFFFIAYAIIIKMEKRFADVI